MNENYNVYTTHASDIIQYLKTEFIEACRHGDLDIVVYFLQNANTQTISSFIASEAIQVAAANGQLDVLAYLTEYFSVSDTQLEDALRVATANGHLNIVSYLVQFVGVSSVQLDDALHTAMSTGDTAIIRYLIEYCEHCGPSTECRCDALF